ncbi:hypothetical protein BDZ85DRAFT_266065 [Elsinoe ampelina]|uniref:Galactosyl transferase GMA12/MNN10 family-domain-containing protein n=1 Tax=Elsinoe ampelina TaxID=302913 RepID=A0A6A6G5I2_9PEZI|nr:hypothetical protein BDZ85DRAFT_266065 [Elsinoe ampelina]
MLGVSETRHFSSKRPTRTLCLLLVPIFLLWLVFRSSVSHSVSTNAPLQPFKTPGDADSSAHRDQVIYSRIGKISSIFYDKVTPLSQAYEDALLSHREHDDLFHYKHPVLRNKLLPGTWSREAYIFYILADELQKSPSERLDWLFWHDADVVLINDLIPLETFVPTSEKWSHVNFIVSNDLNGLNDGVFFLRVNEWALQFMAASLAFLKYHPDVGLRYEGQSTQELLSRTEDWKNRTMHVPQRWFNAYQNYGNNDDIPPEFNWRLGYFEPGDMLVHLPGSATSRTDLLRQWLKRKRDEPSKYIIPIEKLNLTKEVEHFWEHEAPKEEENQVIYWRRFHVVQEAGGKADDGTRKEIKEYRESIKNQHLTQQVIDEHVREIEKKHKPGKIEAMRKLYADRLSGKEKDSIQPAG